MAGASTSSGTARRRRRESRLNLVVEGDGIALNSINPSHCAVRRPTADPPNLFEISRWILASCLGDCSSKRSIHPPRLPLCNPGPARPELSEPHNPEHRQARFRQRTSMEASSDMKTTRSFNLRWTVYGKREANASGAPY